MTLPLSLYLNVLSLALCVLIFVKTALLGHKKPYHYAFLLAMGITVYWNISTLLSFAIFRDTMNSSVGWTFLGIILAPPALFLTAWHYANPEKPFNALHLTLFIIPLVTIILSFTNPYHHLMMKNLSFRHLENLYGPYFMVHAVYSFGLVLVALLIFLRFARKTAGFVSGQTRMLIFAFSVPIIKDLIITLRILDTNQLHNSLGFTIGMIGLWYAIVRYDFLNVTPLAFQAVMDRISNGLVILSRKHQIINYNRPVLEMLGLTGVTLHGWHILDYSEEFGLARQKIQQSLEIAIREQRTLSFIRRYNGNGQDRDLEIQITPLFSGREHRGTVILLNDITHLKRALDELTVKNREIELLNGQLKNLAETDGLTGAYNRRFFDEYYKIEAVRALSRTRYGMESSTEPNFGLAIMDIDNFKSINDRFGHTAGDAVLRDMVQRIKGCIFGRDVICRYGGEEFAVIFTNTGIEGLITAAEKIRSQVAGQPFIIDDQGTTLTVTVSIGLAFFDREFSEDNVSRLISLADSRLYRAKREGKDRVVWDDPPHES